MLDWWRAQTDDGDRTREAAGVRNQGGSSGVKQSHSTRLDCSPVSAAGSSPTTRSPLRPPNILLTPAVSAEWQGEPALPSSLALPPIDRLPGWSSASGDSRVLPADRRPPDLLRQFVDEGTRRWGGEPVALPGELTFLLWSLLMVNIGLGVWLLAVETGTAPCSGWPCEIASLGGHQRLLMVLSGSCVATLLVSAVLTRGLSRAGAVPVAVMIVGALAGAIALLGVVALLALVAACMALLVMVFAIFVGLF
jgi:hypothetical protein